MLQIGLRFSLTFTLSLRSASFSQKEHNNPDACQLLYKIFGFSSIQFFSVYEYRNLVGENKHVLLFYGSNRLFCLALQQTLMRCPNPSSVKDSLPQGNLVTTQPSALAPSFLVLQRHLRPQLCPFQRQPTSNN